MSKARTMRRRLAPAPKESKSLAKYYKDYLAGKVDPGIKCRFELSNGIKIEGPIRKKTELRKMAKS